MSKKQLCLCEWDVIFNGIENENNRGKVDHINKTQIDLVIDIETDIQNKACLFKTTSQCNKQHLSNISGSIH